MRNAVGLTTAGLENLKLQKRNAAAVAQESFKKTVFPKVLSPRQTIPP
jgi:hypothetical protein